MPPRSIWTGTISFGMVSIPVKLYSATQSKDISFNLIHATCGSKIVQKRWCPAEDVEVPWNEVVRGYQHAKDQFITLTEEDLADLPLPSKHTVAITAFVEAGEIDPVYYEKSYVLAPDEHADKPYALLLRSLADKNLVAIATITLRRQEQLCALRPHEGALVLETLYYPDEIRLEREVDLSKVKLSAKELDMASTLIELLRKPFDPSEYHDHYREALAELIEAKLEGKEVVTPPRREAKVIDLAEALARSVAITRSAGARRSGAKAGQGPRLVGSKPSASKPSSNGARAVSNGARPARRRPGAPARKAG
jgi:DNA end-binding protein Ku